MIVGPRGLSSVVSSSAKVRFAASRSRLTCAQMLSNSAVVSFDGASNLYSASSCVEQLALDLLARHRAELVLDLAAYDLAQLLSRFDAERLGPVSSLISSSPGAGDFLDLDVEGRLAPGQMGGRIFVGEGYRDGHARRRRNAPTSWSSKPVDELVRSQHERAESSAAPPSKASPSILPR
jgi:hypothetical protein